MYYLDTYLPQNAIRRAGTTMTAAMDSRLHTDASQPLPKLLGAACHVLPTGNEKNPAWCQEWHGNNNYMRHTTLALRFREKLRSALICLQPSVCSRGQPRWFRKLPLGFGARAVGSCKRRIALLRILPFDERPVARPVGGRSTPTLW